MKLTKQWITWLSMLSALVMTFAMTHPAYSAEKAKKGATAKTKTFTEDEFLSKFSGKPRKFFMESLGAPIKKEQSVKPAGANAMMAGVTKGEDTSKPVNVEMWYYKGVVRYDAKNTYNKTEITFVNDRCMNITFFNTP
jgi:hypothetical protein